MIFFQRTRFPSYVKSWLEESFRFFQNGYPSLEADDTDKARSSRALTGCGVGSTRCLFIQYGSAATPHCPCV